MNALSTRPAALPEAAARKFPLDFPRALSGPPIPWNRITLWALAALILFWAALFYGTWATWGNLTIDCGREMYVPTVLLKGKVLYRDVWYIYGPLGPYFNALLFRLFGVRLEVLYWAGSLSALGSAILLYLTGMRLSSWIAGWTAGAIIVIQAFEPTLDSFPLPYSFSSVYGCFIACLFLWLIVRASTGNSAAWVLCAGFSAALALLLKLEYGAACYATLALLIAARAFQGRSWKSIPKDILAALPGVVLCASAIAWMISLRGYEFLTQENFMSWPTSWFMRKYGAFWLRKTGFDITAAGIGLALLGAVALLLIYLAGRWILLRGGSKNPALLAGAAICLLVFACCAIFAHYYVQRILCGLFFPKQMVLLAAIAAAAGWWFFLRWRLTGQWLAVTLLFSFSVLLAFRILVATSPAFYSIYYDGPAALAFLLLAGWVAIPREGAATRLRAQGELFVCFGSLLAVATCSYSLAPHGRNHIPLVTDRGTILVDRNMAANYPAAISLMKTAARNGESVLSFPEDTSLYFFAATDCPTRVYQLTPGAVAPGKMMNELLNEIDHHNVRYLIWSNLEFPYYGSPRFGVDFDQPLADYLKSHYHPLGPLTQDKGPWKAVVWERNAEGGKR